MKECQLCKQCYPDTVTTCLVDGMPTFHSISGEPVLEGKYKLDKRLGQGGMGVVYCARHAYLKTQHAIKVILPDLVGNDPQLVTGFARRRLPPPRFVITMLSPSRISASRRARCRFSSWSLSKANRCMICSPEKIGCHPKKRRN